MSFKVLSILALVVLVCVFKTAANPAAEENAMETAHGKKSEHGWKKHDAAERHNSTRPSHRFYPRKMKETKKAEKETVKTKRDTEGSRLNLWRKNLEAAMEAARLPADEAVQVVATLAVVESDPLLAEELSTLVDLESVIVKAVDPDSLSVEVELAPVPPSHLWKWWWGTYDGDTTEVEAAVDTVE
ncbi:hypothetical protein DAPPUDRAFT_300253 [Daphnia pulex]|uniref:Uncharacterized protein n=1 Tax=Daphnia pulex TaxID=6669 RepID=E9G5P9_DAPPU|nr:hypothetical protein DAPPUDRAFT_300253 [Daphnia pulex]|eukprot:EFX85245.1 hypothetical protein DAPPUDRAFT_300253 [Daphnia pulex]